MRLMIKLDLRPSENRLSRAWCSFWMSNEFLWTRARPPGTSLPRTQIIIS